VTIEETDDGLVASANREPTDRLDVEDREPSRAAELLGSAGQEFRDANPALATAIGLSAASLRTDRGLPIRGTDLTTPGEEDVDDFVDRLEPSAQRIDQGVSTTVDIATEPGDRLAERVDVTPTDVLEATNDPALAATAATVGTSVGREGAERGVETGVQAFNPVRAVQDSAQFTEAGILAADEVTSEGAAEDIQTAADVSRAAGRLAVQLGPPAAAGAVARDPALAFEAPIAAGTIVAGGALIGSGPAAARAGARTGRRAVDAGSDAVERSAGAVRRQADRFDDLDVSIERDADAGPLEIDGLSPSERAGLAVRRARRDRPSAGEVGRAVRFEGEQIASRARERVSDAAPERPSLSPGSVTPDTEPAVRRLQGAAIDTQLAALRARSAARQAVSNPDEIATRVRGAASEATDRVTGAGSQARDRVTGEARGLEADLDLAVRRVQSNDFLSDESTRRSFPRLGEFTPEPNTRTAARRRLQGLGIDARLAALRAGSTARDLASRPRAAAQSARQRVGESAFLSDTSTGRADVTQLLPSAPSRPSAPTFGVRSRLSGLGDRDLPSPGELTVRIDTGDSLPGQNRRVIDAEDLEGPDPAAGVPEVDEGVTAQGGVQVTDDVAQSSGGGQMTLVRRQAEQVDSATAQSQSRNLSPSTFDGSGTGLAAGSGLLGAASVGDDVDPETAASDVSPDEEEFADFAMDVDTDPGGVQQVDESPAVEGPPTVDEQGSTGEPTRLTPTSEENGVVSDPLDTGAQEGVGTTPERAPQQGAGTDTETTPGVGTGNIQRPIFSTPQQGFTQQTTRIPVNTITPTFTIRTPIRRTPTPTPPLGDRSDRAFGTEAASGGSVGVGSLGAPGPGWFAETIEAAATGFTSEPRSGLAADPGELGDVEAAGFDLATEEVAEGDQGVASVGEVFGLDLDDEEENQEQENPEEFFGFTL
jgi:hypothetical protein